jgi:hypothetical protein
MRTQPASEILGVSYNRLYALKRYNKLRPAPKLDLFQHTVWTRADLERAKVVFASRRLRCRKPITPPADTSPNKDL